MRNQNSKIKKNPLCSLCLCVRIIFGCGWVLKNQNNSSVYSVLNSFIVDK